MSKTPSPSESVRAALGPGEELLWSHPLSRRAAQKVNPAIGFAHIAAYLLAALTAVAAATIVALGQSRDPWLFLPVFPLPMLAAFFWLFALLASRHLQRTGLFAATNRRLIIALSGSTQSYPYAQVDSLSVNLRPNGLGDLLFATAPSGTLFQAGVLGLPIPTRTRIGFFDVPGIDALQQLVHRCQADAKSSPPTTAPSPTAAPIPRSELRFGQQRPRTFEGSLLLVWGALFVVISVVVTASQKEWTPLIGAVIGMIAILTGLRMFLWRDILSLDPVARTYRWQRGWAPRLKQKEGPLSDFDCVRLSFESRRQTGTDQAPVKVERWWIRLLWKNPGDHRPDFSLVETPDRYQALVEGARLAAALQLPFDDAAKVEKDHQEAQDRERARRWRPFARAAGIAAGIIVLNALLPGFYWQERWLDENANRFERCRNGYRTLTRVTSAAGKSRGFTDRRWFILGQSTRSEGFPAQKDFKPGERLKYRSAIRIGSFPQPAAPQSWE